MKLTCLTYSRAIPPKTHRGKRLILELGRFNSLAEGLVALSRMFGYSD